MGKHFKQCQAYLAAKIRSWKAGFTLKKFTVRRQYYQALNKAEMAFFPNI